ncbi:phosphoribosylglycinamide formyltransferase [Auriculariales sp. MPI-PUGE-AT-0066]|nr:phosphoribosylglycinamide formyltransferase [Auriculariales sp. MPI-PUGE-AT-0066]
MTPRRIAVLISGSGSNLQALIDACATGRIPNAEIVAVLSNRKAAFGLERARKVGIATEYLALQPYLKTHHHDGKTREDYDAEVARLVLMHTPELVVLAGWMHIVSDRFLDALNAASVPAINLHPALPGAFDGADALQRAWDAFQRGEITKTGAMVHYVVREVDRGEPIVVREIEMSKDEDQEAFEKRVHAIEWEIIVEATHKVLDAPNRSAR